MTFEDLESPRHFVEFGGLPALEANTFVGFAARDDEGQLAAIACAFLADGRWWAVFGRSEKARLTPSNRVALILAVETLIVGFAKAGIKELRAELDDTKPRARDFLEHMGFCPVSDTEWVCELAKPRASGIRRL